ncbi:MAG TPA: hypothetical protein VMD75_00725 [Candidatus Binataceae bacterium]|nr:hypothetical protein [Candidatus Binataceae bacterium]
MPVKEPPVPRQVMEPSSTHTWLLPKGRKLNIVPGTPLVHRLCTSCQRNFVHDLNKNEWYAAFPRMFDFERYDDEISARWLTEECPRTCVTFDEEARKSGNKSRVDA